MNNSSTKSDSWAAANKKNTLLLAYWTFSWVATQALAVFGPEFIWQSNALLTSLAILVNVLVGFGMILALIRHLKGLDEMQQRIQLNAMGISLGAGLVLGMAYSSLDTTNVIPFDAEISHLVILMSLTYVIGIFAGHRKYQ
jgi:cytochrome c biogenesis protein CcdA